MSTDSERPLVITGGSIDVVFSDSFEPAPAPSGDRKFKQKDGNKKIQTITVTIGDDPPQTYNVQNGRCEVRIDYR